MIVDHGLARLRLRTGCRRCCTGRRTRRRAPTSSIAKAHFNTGQTLLRARPLRRRRARVRRGLSPVGPRRCSTTWARPTTAPATSRARSPPIAASSPRSADSRRSPTASSKRVELLQHARRHGRRSTARVDGSTVTLDGAAVGATPLAEPIEVNPGRHKLEVAHEGLRHVARARSTCRVGGRRTRGRASSSIAGQGGPRRGAATTTTPVYKKWWLWTAVGGAVVVAGGHRGRRASPATRRRRGPRRVQLPAGEVMRVHRLSPQPAAAGAAASSPAAAAAS